ncbi:MAG: EAL domain-containing protein, partial [Cyanobacteria bacterium J06636_16]
LLYSHQEAERFEQEVFPALEASGAWQGEAIATRKDGSTFIQGVSLTLTEEGLLISVCRDISDLKEAREMLTYNTLHDPLTDLPNRKLLTERLELAVNRARRSDDYRYAILFLDLDRFKVVNDSLGHSIGDQLLIAIAQRLKERLRDIDLVARIGGDEFVILLEDIHHKPATVIQITERILADFQAPFTINQYKIFTGFSIGIVLGTKDYHQASNVIRDADIAMYQAKRDSKNSYKFFDAGMHEQALNRLTIENDIRKALENEEFLLHYQPIFDLANHQLTGFEALLRWQHPTKGLIFPDEFIPVAEESGLIMFVDDWVFAQASQQMKTWLSRFPNQFPLKVSINLSTKDLRKKSLIQDIDLALNNTGLDGGLIVLEITESMLIENIDETISLLTQLKSRNIQISIDDFGTGYSSLRYLHRLPVHNLKIDRSFVSHMETENRNYQVVDTIITLSKQLGLTVVAEGIETAQQVQQLQQLGCQLGQGYWYSRPLTSHSIEANFLERN